MLLFHKILQGNYVQGKSVSTYLLMSINDLGAMAGVLQFKVFVLSMLLFYKILQVNPRGNLCPHIFS